MFIFILCLHILSLSPPSFTSQLSCSQSEQNHPYYTFDDATRNKLHQHGIWGSGYLHPQYQNVPLDVLFLNFHPLQIDSEIESNLSLADSDSEQNHFYAQPPSYTFDDATRNKLHQHRMWGSGYLHPQYQNVPLDVLFLNFHPLQIDSEMESQFSLSDSDDDSEREENSFLSDDDLERYMLSRYSRKRSFHSRTLQTNTVSSFDYDQFLSDLLQSHKIVHFITQGNESCIYSTLHKHIVAKIPSRRLMKDYPTADFIKESRFLNKLYDYPFSWIDETYPQVMYMYKIDGTSWFSLRNSPHVSLYEKASITEKILVLIDKMHAKRLRHNDLHSSNIVVSSSFVYFIDPSGQFKPYLKKISDSLRREHYAKEHKIFVQQLRSLGKKWCPSYPFLIVEKGIEKNWGDIGYQEQKEVLADFLSNDSFYMGDLLETPLHRACLKGYTDKVVEFLKRGDPINAKDSRGYTPLMLACINGHTEIVQCLIYFKADVNIQSSYGKTPLLFAIFYHYPLIIDILLKVPDIDLNIQDSFGTTALFQAVSSCNNDPYPITNILLDHGANPYHLNPLRQTILHVFCWYSFQKDHSETLKLLLQLNIDLNLMDSFKKTVFDYAKEKKRGPWLMNLLDSSHRYQTLDSKILLSS